MIVVLQKVTEASVSVDSKVVGKIDKGLVLLVGFCDGDDINVINYMVNKIINLRVFNDINGVMNLSLKDVGASILSISQFTLYGDCKKGARPSYIKAMKGDQAIKLYDLFNKELRKYANVSEGIFGANMLVSLVNDGPTTIIIEKENDK